MQSNFYEEVFDIQSIHKLYLNLYLYLYIDDISFSLKSYNHMVQIQDIKYLFHFDIFLFEFFGVYS